MATIPRVQLFRNSNIISGRSAAIDTLERKKEYVPDGGLILATYSSDNGVKTLLGIVRNSGSENAQITIMDVEGAAENVQDAIDALSAYTNTKLTEEKNARESADNTLQTNIDALSSYTDTKLSEEAQARVDADTTLQTNIDNLSSSTDTKINAEVTRATKKEGELSSTITSNYTTLSTAIDDEKKRAEAKESDLNAKIESLGESLGNTNSATVTSGEYSSQDKKIYLKNISGETLSEIDATDFIKDGMVSNVEVADGNLKISFNTDAGHEDINIPISAIFNANNYYTKTEIDTKVDDINSQLSEYGQTTSQALNDLGTRLEQEATTRESADTTLQGNIDALSSSTDTKIASETTARQEADTTLQTNINNVNSGLTAHTANTTVHVTQEDKDKWNTPTDLSNYYNKQEVDAAIANVDVTEQLQNYYTKTEIDTKVDDINSTIESYGQVTSQALNDLGTRLDDYGKVTSQSLNDLSTKFGDYYTKTEVDTAISNVDVTSQLQNYYTKTEVDSKDATLQTALDALDAHVSENEDIVSQSLNDLNNRIGDTYVKSYIDALEARIAELETKFLNMENNGLQAGEY